MQPQLSAFTQKLIGAVKEAFFCFSSQQILNVGLLTCSKDLNNITGGKDVAHSFPFIYLWFCKHNHLGKSQKTDESLPIRTRTLQVAPKGNFVCRCRAGGVRSSPVCDTLLRLTVYPPALARNNTRARMIHAHS